MRRAIGFALGGLLLTVVPTVAAAQTMPGRVYTSLEQRGHQDLAKRISKKLDHRANPDEKEVRDLLQRWETEAGGPETAADWLAVTRLWIRAGRAAEAEMALHEADRAEAGVVAGAILLDQARVGFLAGQRATAVEAYWKGCDQVDEATTLEYWLDVEVLATPSEIERWEAFRTLPVNQRKLCAFLRRFWNERAMASAQAVPERMAEHYRRIKYALDNHRRRGNKKGATFSNKMGRPTKSVYDDRGLVYLRMGPPDRTTSFAGNTEIGQHLVSAECFQPNESWAYDYPDGTRVYHFSTLGGTDDWWLIENLSDVYRCGSPDASASGQGVGQLSPVNEHRGTIMSQAANLVLQDLYRSRQGLDPRYARRAQMMRYEAPIGTLLGTSGSAALEAQRQLQIERAETRDDVGYLVSSVPERPRVDARSRMLVEVLQFGGRQAGFTRVWLNSLVEGDRLTPETLPDGTFRYRVEGHWALLGPDGAYQRLQSEVVTNTRRRLRSDESVPVRMVADLPPGDYRYTLLLRDVYSGNGGAAPAGNFHSTSLRVNEFDLTTPQISSVAVAADSGGAWSPGPGIALRPSPAHFTGPDGIAFIYFEAYHLTPGGRFTTHIRLEPRDDKGESFELRFAADALPAGHTLVRRLLRLDLNETKPDDYDMSVLVEDLESGRSTLPYRTQVRVERRPRS
ncbi:MAG: GWxTD domain-containing protein [Gemmatimonadota bacterium]